MEAFFDKVFTRYPRKSTRAIQMMSPLTSLFLIALPVWGAFVFPFQLAYLIIFFDVYWLYKSVNLVVCAFVATRNIKAAEVTDWNAKAKKLPNYNLVNHVVVIPTYKESAEKLSKTLDVLATQTLPLKHIFIFMAMEEREEGIKEKAKFLGEKYKGVFGGIYFAFHPDLPNEVRGKSSNQAYAAKVAYDVLIKQKKLDIEYMTVSSVDADSLFDKNFFANLTYSFLTVDKPVYKFWQSANVAYNNFWQVPAATRIISFFGSLYRTALLVQHIRLIPNSTYTLSFKLLHDMGYWDVDVVPEDYRAFFKAYFMTKGKVSVVPIFLKTSMDSVQSHSYVGSLFSRYHQERRWAWGISDDAQYVKWWLSVKGVPFWQKTFLVSGVIFEHIMWPVNWFFVTISANLVVFLNPDFFRTSLGYNLPRISGFILTLCLFALFIMLYIDFDLRTKHYSRESRIRQFIFPLEFVLMPIGGLFLSTIPAIISHVQLLIGKKMDYKVTDKI